MSREEHSSAKNGRDRRLLHRLRRNSYLQQTQPELPAVLGEHPAGEAKAAPHPHHHHPHKPTHPASVELEKTVEHLREQLVRAQAEFDNYRKRQKREEQQRLDLANQRLVEQLLPVLDNFGRAMANPGESVQGLLSGIDMVHKQLLDALKQHGLEAVNPVGQPFDPNQHEAVAVAPDPDKPDNQVLDVFQEGYLLKGRLVRPAMVRVVKN